MAERADAQAMRALAEALAPYLRELFEAEPRATRPKAGAPASIERRLARFVADLPRELTEYALVLTETLQRQPHRVDLKTLARLLGAADGREVSGILLTPLKKRANNADIEAEELPWRDDVRPGGLRVLEDPSAGQLSSRLHEQLLAHREQSGWNVPSAAQMEDENSRRPPPSSIYVWAPEYVENLEHGADGHSSCLRTDRPGTRAIIYQAHKDQGIVAIFDVTSEPEPSTDWNYTAKGIVHLLDPPIRRDELLLEPELRGVFERIQGRRRIPSAAQEPFRRLLPPRLPPNREDPLALPIFATPNGAPQRRARAGSRRQRLGAGRTARPVPAKRKKTREERNGG